MMKAKNKDEIQKIQVRISTDLYQQIKDRAAKNRRSINSEILFLLELNIDWKGAGNG